MDIARYSKDEFKKVMGELVKYEEFVTELTVSKTIRGGKLPARVYNIIIMEPDAVNLAEIEKMKKQQQQAGQNIPKVELFGFSGPSKDSIDFLKLTFTDVIVTSYQIGGSEGDTVPVDSISLNFAKIEFEYTPLDEKGKAGSTIKTGYDLKTNKKV